MPVQAAFTSGELSPALYARVDFAKYQTGAKTLLNFIALPHGGAQNRAGTYFIAEVKDSSKRHRLIPFQFSTQQAYCLEFGNLTMRVVKDAGQVLEGDKTISGATQANPVVVTATGHSYSNGDWIVISAVVGMTELNGKTFVVTNKAANTFELYDVDGNPIDGTGYTAYTSGGVANKIVEIVTPYSESDLPLLRFAQSADIMYILHPDYYPQKLSRTSHVDWTLEDAPFTDGPYKSQSIDDLDITLTPAARSGNNIAITASAAFFVAAHVGTPIRLGYLNPNNTEETVWGYGIIDQVTDSTNARVDITNPFGFEYIQNHEFEAGIGFWEDHSTSPSTLTYDAPGSMAVLTQGASGYADIRQAIEVTANETCKLTVDLNQVQGQVRIAIGTTSGGTDILGWQTEAAAGVKTYTVTPPQGTMFLTITGSGSASGNVSKIAEVSFVRQDLSTNDWRQAAWSSVNGYPQTVTFFEQRVCFGGNAAEPQTFWMTKPASEDFGFSSPAADDDGLVYTMSARQVNAIQWLEPFGDLVAGTSGKEWGISSGDSSKALAPTQINVKAQSHYGSANLPSMVVGDSILFVVWGGLQIRDLQNPFDVSGYQGKDISILSEHLFWGYQIDEWVHARNPYSTIWCIRNDGILLGFTYLREHEVEAWHRHETDGEYESVCAIPGDTTDEVYFVVKRIINGTTRRYIEKVMPRITDEDTYNYFFVDCGLTYSGAEATIISGLEHLEGKDVIVLANGAVIADKTVSNGQITLNRAATLVHIGLSYTSDLETLNLEHYGERGSSQGKNKTVTSVNLHLRKTRGVWVGKDADHLDEVKFYDEAEGEDPPALFKGVKELKPKFGVGKEQTVLIRQTYPLPLTVLAVIPNLKVSTR